MGMFYSIEIYFKVGRSDNMVTIYDSLKLINSSVEEIAKNFNLPIRKGNIDYNEYREINHKITEEELAYLKNDCEIIARALEYMFNENLTKMTIGSNALNHYQKNFKSFNKVFPEIPKPIDLNMRQAYKGGFTYLNPFYKDKLINENIACFDVNSLYPSVMYYEPMPIGSPVYFSGKYHDNKVYTLYIQHISCSFKVKKNKIPIIQIKHNINYVSNEFLIDSGKNGEAVVDLYLTNVELPLFFEHYEVADLEYEDGFMFQTSHDLFKDYIDYWNEVKMKNTGGGNPALRAIAKLMLNSLYGKFAKSLSVREKIPYLNDDIVKYKYSDKKNCKGVYLPIGIFITSYARFKTITTSQKIKDYSIKKYGVDKYIYSDTDSIYTTMTDENELKQFIDIDDKKLGFWKYENKDNLYTKGKFLRQKCYICEYRDKKTNDLCIKTTIAGLPKKLSDKVNFDNFNENFTCGGKLTFKHVKGGVVLVETTYSIKT